MLKRGIPTGCTISGIATISTSAGIDYFKRMENGVMNMIARLETIAEELEGMVYQEQTGDVKRSLRTAAAHAKRAAALLDETKPEPSDVQLSFWEYEQ